MGCRGEIGKPCRRIHECFAIIAQLLRLGFKNDELILALPECQLNGVIKAFLVFGRNLETVDYQLHTVVFIAVELHAKGDFAHLAINAHMHIAFFAQLLKEVFVVALAILDKRC